MSSAGTVLVTGASGYLGAAVTLELIAKGYKVKGAVEASRSSPHIEWTLVPDGAEAGAFDVAIQEVDYIIHFDSPILWIKPEDNERDVLAPAVQSTKNIMEAAAKHPRVKHVVITSSCAAMTDIAKGMEEGCTYTSDDCDPITREAALSSDSGLRVYVASKALAEKEAWEFLEKNKPTFTMTAICTPMIFGPPSQPFDTMAQLNPSVAEVRKLISGTAKEVPVTTIPIFTDVRDVARLNVAALTNPLARNQRYLAVGGHYSFDQISCIVAQAFPSEKARITPSDNCLPPPLFGADSSKAEQDFGVRWIGLEQSDKDMAKELYAKKAVMTLKASHVMLDAVARI